ncbi:MAG: Holliday junction resolvase RuvX [Epsilonproteobacteria bacterium]|nr:MAG: Holliday junction resolvase RuvX [Campylobacterota bacterium]
MQKKYASIDVGLKRIGCAISVGLDIVNPQEAIIRKNRNQASSDVDKFLKEWEIDTLVIGYPESSEDMMKRVDHFSKLLEFEGEIVFQNENLSTQEAKEMTMGVVKHKRDGRLDSIAAKIILERYLVSLKKVIK